MPMVESNIQEVIDTINQHDESFEYMCSRDEVYTLINSKGLLNARYAKYLLQAYSQILKTDLFKEIKNIK